MAQLVILDPPPYGTSPGWPTGPDQRTLRHSPAQRRRAQGGPWSGKGTAYVYLAQGACFAASAPRLGGAASACFWYRAVEVTSIVAVSTLDWEALQRVIAGDVVFPGSAAYEELPKPFNARFHDVQPRAIVRCATPQDVAEAVLFVGRHGLECATRSGGHCFAGRSVSRGVVIDVSPMDAVSASGGVATVGAGARHGWVYSSLEEHGLAVPRRHLSAGGGGWADTGRRAGDPRPETRAHLR
jgi:FAD binding domain